MASPSAPPIFSKFSIASIPTPCRLPKISPPPRVDAAQTAGQPLASEGAESSEPSKISSSSAPDGVGTVTISSDPDGAEIFIDDKFLGNTPATLKLPPGSHAVLLKFPGHADWGCTLEVLKSSKVSLKATLEPIS
ncbi:MAG TPA: PEGA domain-containing protein [Candidatus Limnocylindria bacterium]|nr:PEGA domain-containing protein [Candidatus Limnocylindria bacterium]